MSKYDDIINLPHYELKFHKRMSMASRSGQFAPFAALTGYDSDVKESIRETSKKKILTEDEKTILDRKLNSALQFNNKNIKVVYFVPDKYKDGGKYITIIDKIKKTNNNLKEITLMNNTKIKIDDIISIDFIDEQL